jgi:hypothetical protein
MNMKNRTQEGQDEQDERDEQNAQDEQDTGWTRWPTFGYCEKKNMSKALFIGWKKEVL